MMILVLLKKFLSMLRNETKQSINILLKNGSWKPGKFKGSYWILKWYGWYLFYIEEYNPNKEYKILIVFDIIVDMLFNKKLQQVVTELFVRCKKQNIYLVFITPSYFSVPTLLVQYLDILLFEKRGIFQI